jgi:putative transposase
MKKGRRNHSAEFRARVAVESIKGLRTTAELASEYEIHPTQIAKWKKQALEGLAGVFSDREERKWRDMEELKARLYQQIGRLQVELDWLKKKCGLEA